MSKLKDKIKITLEFEVTDQDQLFEAAKAALTKLRNDVVAKHGEDPNIQYAQALETVIKEQLFDPGQGELHLPSCVLVILDHATTKGAGVEIVASTAEPA